MKTDIFGMQNTCMEISVSLLCLFVHIHEPLYRSTVVYYNTVFHCSSLCIDHPTFLHIFLIRVELIQTRKNK